MEYMKKAGFVAGLMLLTLFAACGDDNSSNSITSLVQTSTTAYVGEPYHIGVIVKGNTDFSASVDKPGLTCVKSGSDVACNATASGEYVVTVTAINGSKNSKTASVTVPDLAFRYGTEDGDELPFFADDSESGEIKYNAAGHWTADVQGGPSWITLTCASCVGGSSAYETVGLYEDGDNGASHLEGGAGNNSIIINLQLNRSGEERAAIILIAANGKTIELTVLQKAERADGTVPNKYEAPEDISVEIYDGETLMATITAEDLEYVRQEIIVSAGRNYVAYAITDVLEYLDCELSDFTRIMFSTSDAKHPTREYDNFDTVYIAIGYIGAGESLIPETDGVRALPEGVYTTSGGSIQLVNRITVNPVSEEPDPEDPGADIEFPIPEDISIDVFDGAKLLGTITADILDKIEQRRVITADNSRYYVAYAIEDALARLNDVPSPFTRILYDTTDNRPTMRTSSSFANAYIAIGYYQPPSVSLSIGGVPRILPDGAGTLNGSVAQYAMRITVNPLDDVENDYTVPAHISVDFYDGATLVGSIDATDLEEIQQKLVYIETINSSDTHQYREYVSYSIADVINHMGWTFSTFTEIKYSEADGSYPKTVDRTSFARAYITIGYLNWGNSNTAGSGAYTQDIQLIYDSYNLNNKPGSHGEIIKINSGGRITVNP